MKNIAILLVLLLCSSQLFSQSSGLRASKGVVDLTDWDKNQSKIITLDGEWEFYWNQLIYPSDFGDTAFKQNVDYVSFPSIWNKYEINGEKLSGDGYATYRLQVTGLDSQESMGLYIPSCYSSYSLWVNGKKISQNGLVGNSRSTAVPKWIAHARTIETPTDGNLEIILQVANFWHFKGGFNKSIEFGKSTDVIKRRETAVIITVTIAASLFAGGLFFLGMYFFLRKGKALMLFATACLFMSLYFMTADMSLLSYLLPDIGWKMVVRIEYLSLYASILLAFSYILTVYPKSNVNLVAYGFQFAILGFILLVLFFPTRVFTAYTSVFIGIIYLFIVYAIFVAARAFITNEHRGLEGIFGMVCVFASLIVGTLDYLGIISDTFYLGELGMVGFILSCSFDISHQFAKAYRNEEFLKEKTLEQSKKILNKNHELNRQKKEIEDQQYQIIDSQRIIQNQNAKLQEHNSLLELKVEHRNSQLERSIDEIKLAHKELDQFFYQSSHSMRAPVANLLGLCHLATVDNDNSLQYLDMIKKTVGNMDAMLASLQRINTASNHVAAPAKVRIFDVITRAIAACEPPEDFKIEMQMDPELQINTDSYLIEILAKNLIDNSFKFFTTRKQPVLKIYITKTDKKRIKIHIKDNGPGIEEAVQARIFDLFYSANLERKGNGLGLYEARIISKKIKGSLSLESSNSNGTHFIIEIPACLLEVEDVFA